MTDGLAGVLEADDFDFLADLDFALLDAAGHDGAAAGDREHVFDRHQERLFGLAHGLRDVAVDRVHQIENRLAVGAVGLAASAVERVERAAANDGNVVALEIVLGQQVAHFELDQVEQLGIVDHIDLVHEHDDRRHADLVGEQDMLARLRHRAVVGADHQDRAVHLRGAGDHVLDVVGVSRAIDVRVVALGRLVLDVRDRDRDAALFFFGRLVDLIEGGEGRELLRGENLGNRRG